MLVEYNMVLKGVCMERGGHGRSLLEKQLFS